MTTEQAEQERKAQSESQKANNEKAMRTEMKLALMRYGITEIQAVAIVIAMWEGKIPNVAVM